MSRSGQLNVSRTKDIRSPNEYILALQGEFAQWSFDEVQAPTGRGQWRELMGLTKNQPLDLEIGTGNGYHFAYRAMTQPTRGLIGIELKYKPLIQSIRRAVRDGAKNMRILRYNAFLIDQLFVENELDDVFIHFPDPWEKLRSHKHRLIQDDFLRRMFVVQRPGACVEFKTDSREYFDWALERFNRGPYIVEAQSFDLHASEYAAQNYMTHFERLFTRQGLPTHFARLRKPL
jgi:tRNA (guanine-N7-)-methyltransferase